MAVCEVLLDMIWSLFEEITCTLFRRVFESMQPVFSYSTREQKCRDLQ